MAEHISNEATGRCPNPDCNILVVLNPDKTVPWHKRATEQWHSEWVLCEGVGKIGKPLEADTPNQRKRR